MTFASSFLSLLAFATLALNPSAAQNSNGLADRLDPGSVIPVRASELIDLSKSDARVYGGIVDRDLRDGHDRIIIPRGSRVELMVRRTPANALTLDVDSIVVNGRRYALRTEERRVPPRPDDSLIGSLVATVTGEPRGRTERIPRDTVITFRLERALDAGIPDSGVDRDGHHYHDAYFDRYSH